MAKFAGTNCDFAIEQVGQVAATEVLLDTENWELNIDEIADEITNSRSGILDEHLFIRYMWQMSCDLVLDSTKMPSAVLPTLGNGVYNQRGLVRLYIGDRVGAASFTDFYTGVVRIMNTGLTQASKKAGRVRVTGKGISILYAPGASVPGDISPTNFLKA
jgi:hypothetical protein